jgi:hypothetical protein
MAKAGLTAPCNVEENLSLLLDAEVEVKLAIDA